MSDQHMTAPLYHLLHWLDAHIFRHRWSWLCNIVWDWQMARDVEVLERIGGAAIEYRGKEVTHDE